MPIPRQRERVLENSFIDELLAFQIPRPFAHRATLGAAGLALFVAVLNFIFWATLLPLPLFVTITAVPLALALASAAVSLKVRVARLNALTEVRLQYLAIAQIINRPGIDKSNPKLRGLIILQRDELVSSGDLPDADLYSGLLDGPLLNTSRGRSTSTEL